MNFPTSALAKVLGAAAVATIAAAAVLDPLNHQHRDLRTERDGSLPKARGVVECDPLASTLSARRIAVAVPPRADGKASIDIGVLSTSDGGVSVCADKGEVCHDDPTSSLGGRCVRVPTAQGGDNSKATSVHSALAHHRRLPAIFDRRLELDTPPDCEIQNCTAADYLSCGAESNCTAAMCECGASGAGRTSFEGFGADCAPELSDVCEGAGGGIDGCFPNNEGWRYFFSNYGCEFSECVNGEESYATCSCNFADKYCTGYAYYFGNSTDYPHVEYYCNTATCCGEAGADEVKKRACQEGMDWHAAGYATLAPTVTKSAPTPNDPAPTPSDPAPTPSDPAPTPSDPAPTPTDPAPPPSDPAPTPTDPAPPPTDAAQTPSTAPTPSGAAPTIPARGLSAVLAIAAGWGWLLFG